MLKTSDTNKIIENYLKKTNFAQFHLNSMNDFYSQGLSLILTQFFEIKKVIKNKRTELLNGKEILTIGLEVKFSNVELNRPQTKEGNPMLPSEARLGGKTYSGKLTTDITIKITAYLSDSSTVEKEETVKGYPIANLPIAVGTNSCNTWNLSNKALTDIGEDSTDLFGYFIIAGSEWHINNIFSRKYNVWHYFHNETEQEIDLARAEIISMPGDSFENSSEIKVQYLKTKEIVFTFTSDKYFKTIGIPFYIILKILGVEDEQSIVENIIPDTNFPEIDNKMRKILCDSIKIKSKNFPLARTISNNVQLISYCIDVIARNFVNTTTGITSNIEKEAKIQEEKAVLTEFFMSNLDNNILPHQGKLQEHRFIKAHYLCLGINLILKCYFDFIPSTSRDSHEIKRIHTAGDSFSRMFKREVNKAVVKPVKINFDKICQNNFFENIEPKVLISAIDPQKLQNGIIKNLNTGISDEKGADGKSKKNRTPSENVKRKNIAANINNYTITRSPNPAGSYQNERAFEMRRVQGGQPVCIIQSSEGINVGMGTNLSLGIVISKGTSTEVMKSFLLNTNLIIPWNKTLTKKGTFGIINSLKVMVNGQWIGYIESPHKLISYCKEKRRGWDINSLKKVEDNSFDKKFSISQNYALDFRTDRGRGLIPYIIVRNNTNFDPIGQKIIGSKMDIKTGKNFKQIILFTQEHVKKLKEGSITIDYLFEEGVIDYIAPEELQFVHAADSLERFYHYQSDPKIRFTHVLIPLTLISIITAFSPLLHHGPPTRTSLATNHLRNACSLYSLAPAYRFDKQGYYSINNQFPLVYTAANILIPTNGINAMVFVAPQYCHSQEDSLVANKSAAERGACKILKYTFHKSILDKNEEFIKPNELNVNNIKKIANYSKLEENGFPKIGTYLEKNDIIIGKRAKNINSNKKQIYEDKSEVYIGERALVVGIVQNVDSSFKLFISIRLLIERPLTEGQKFSSRMGQKGMIVKCLPQSELYYTEEGIVPMFIMDPHAYPTRMTVPQLLEAILATIALQKGGCFDGTLSICVSVEESGYELEKYGFKRNGSRIVYNPQTGKSLKTNIFAGPMYYQRLNKFYEESAYSVSEGNRAIINRQPTSGRQHNGGLRLGEMEKDCFFSHGCILFLFEKYSLDCDGMDIYICKTCGYRPNNRNEEGLYTCNVCNSYINIVKVPSRFSSHSILNYMEALGVSINYVIQPFEFYD